MKEVAKVEALGARLSSVEDCLMELSRYGLPRVSKTNTGWYAKIEVFVTGQGVGFEVSSDFGHPSPNKAVQQCHTRLTEAMRKIKET